MNSNSKEREMWGSSEVPDLEKVFRLSGGFVERYGWLMSRGEAS